VFFVFIIISQSLFSCKKAETINIIGDLIKTDRAFSSMSESQGMHKAFLTYIADDGVLLRDDSYPVTGKESVAELFNGREDKSFSLVWEPIFERLSSDGDIGYTYGTFTSTVYDSGIVTQGTYVTIWQKEDDGSWKFVLDSGTQGLPESK
jgi:ketosteroid isomerase-like protein